MIEERREFINETIRMLNTIEGKLTDVRYHGKTALEYIREKRIKLNKLLEREKEGGGK